MKVCDPPAGKLNVVAERRTLIGGGTDSLCDTPAHELSPTRQTGRSRTVLAPRKPQRRMKEDKIAAMERVRVFLEMPILILKAAESDVELMIEPREDETAYNHI